MRLLRSASLALGALLVPGVCVAACSAKHDPAPGEILLAIDANLNVPADMDQLGVSVMAEDGTVASIDQVYPMAPVGFAKFPATLAIVRGTSQPVDIKVAAFKNGEAFILREIVTTLPADRTAILRVDLNWLDEGSTSGVVTQVQSLTTGMPCVSGQTSVEGACQSFTLDSGTLPTYTSGSLVPTSDAGGLCLDIPDCVVGQPGAVIPVPMIPQPTLGTTMAPDGGTSPSCAIAPPTTFAGDFNIGIIPKSGAAGWCNGSVCAVPLENDVAPSWPVVDGMVQLPLGVCTSTQIAGLLLSQVTAGCPQYGSIEHPACQGYGVDGGATPGGGGGGRKSDGGTVEGGTTGPNLSVIENGSDPSFRRVLGIAVDPTRTGDAGDVDYTFRTSSDGGTELAEEQFTTAPLNFGGVTAHPAAFDLASSTFAATSDRAAAASVNGVDVFFLGDGTDAGHYPVKTPSSLVSIGFDQQGLLLAAGFNSGLSWFLPDGGSGINPVFADGQPSLVAFNEGNPSFVVLSMATQTGQSDELRSLNFEQAGPEMTALPAPFVVAAPNSIAAIAVADANTVVWVTLDGTFYVSTIDADAGAGTKLGVNMTLYVNVAASVPALTGGGGRIAWIDASGDVWSMRVARGAAQGPATDLSTRETNGLGWFKSATTVALSPTADLLHWTQSDTGNSYVTLISELPQ